MNYLDKAKLKRQIERLTKQLERYEVEDQHKIFNFFGGENYGYIKGRISVLEDLLDQLEEEEE
tara:strand:+ start:54 stop:242 length:189 start_codon:yes stop_codon:yes gene_type:complete